MSAFNNKENLDLILNKKISNRSISSLNSEKTKIADNPNEYCFENEEIIYLKKK